MANAVWKFSFEPNDYIDIDMPAGAKPLYVDSQHGLPCLWALVDPSARMVTRRFRMAGTGHLIAEKASALQHVGTWLMHGGSLVFHLFEIVGK